MRFLLDDGRSTAPNRAEILAAMQWLVDGAAPGDSIFRHYSGHGGQMRNDNGDEKDSLDETMVPLDYQTNGQIRDDDLFKALVVPTPEGVLLTVVMDCCHSGSVLDLPYEFLASDPNVQNGAPDELPPNQGFDFSAIFAIAMALYKAYKQGGGSVPQGLKMAN
jgi:hypothetical protein